jgi:hypothetical protein
MHLYLDDSGTRHPDRDPGQKPAHKYDWFGIGGVVLRESDEDAVRAKHAALCAKWQINYPLHSTEIRASSKNFKWVKELSPERKSDFMDDLGSLATTPELIATACVIDRPGYNHRYRERYGRARWNLCKTAFVVAVERVAKLARESGFRLRVYVERADKGTDAMIRGYYDALRTNGHPFQSESASKYTPLTVAEFRETLYDFKPKMKTSPPMQLADLCLWPMCIGGYDPMNRPYLALKESGTLIDSRLRPEDVPTRGIKYSCWDLRVPEKNGARS